MSYYSSPNRYVCEVLEEMRKVVKVLSVFNMWRYKPAMAMLIEEAQTLVNRMEASMHDWTDIRRAHDEIKKLKKEIKELEEKKKALGETSE